MSVQSTLSAEAAALRHYAASIDDDPEGWKGAVSALATA